MKKLLLTIMILTSANLLKAQVRFQHLFGGPAYDDIQEVMQTSDLGYIMCGTTESFGAGQSDILVVKTDAAGLVQWSKAYGSAGNDFGVAIKKAPAGGYVVAGFTYGLSADTLTDDFLLINISSAGNILWAKTYGGVANDEAHALAVMPDSGFVIAGTTASFGGVTSQAGYVVRTDAAGNKLWAKAITQNSDQQLFAVDATDDGGCIVAGYTYVSTGRLFDIFMAKLNASGVKEWVKRYGGTNSEQAYSVKQSLTGGFVAGGYTSSFGTGQDDAFILRTNGNGDLTWFNTYGTSESERARTILWGSGDGIVISGQARVSSAVGPIDHNFLLKTDTLGSVQWSKTYGPSVNISLAYSTAFCADGGYIMGGLTGGFGAVQNDMYLVKTSDVGGSGCNQASPQLFNSAFTPTDSAGGTFTNGGNETTVTVIKTNAPVTTSIQCNSTGVGIAEPDANSAVHLFPNPASDVVTVTYFENTNDFIHLQLTDMQGKVLFEKTIPVTGHSFTVPVDFLSSGFYMMKISATNYSHTSKLLIQK